MAPRQVTLAELRAETRRLADCEQGGSHDFVSDSELDERLNAACDDLYDRVVQISDGAFYLSEHVFTGEGTGVFPLPDDFLSLKSIRNGAIDCIPWEWRERGRLWAANSEVSVTGSSRDFAYDSRNFYRIIGGNLTLMPVPAVGGTVTIEYVPVRRLLKSPLQPLLTLNGWNRYVTLLVAMEILAKEESDTSFMAARFADTKERIEESVRQYDNSGPKRIADTSREPW